MVLIMLAIKVKFILTETVFYFFLLRYPLTNYTFGSKEALYEKDRWEIWHFMLARLSCTMAGDFGRISVVHPKGSRFKNQLF